MVLHVAICDDETQICRELEIALTKILDRLNIMHEIDTYSTGEGLCSKIEAAAHYNLIFLDIEFSKSKINGVEVGKRIRDIYDLQTVSIVYISWEKSYSLQLHEIRPLHFLIKPLKSEELEQVVKTYLKLSGRWADDFVYKIQQDSFRVKVKDIVYIESVKRKLILHLSDGREESFYGALKEVYREQLQKFDFLLTHASYAVNYSYISAFLRNTLVLNTGETLPISKHKKSEVEEAYFAIMERQGVV